MVGLQIIKSTIDQASNRILLDITQPVAVSGGADLVRDGNTAFAREPFGCLVVDTGKPTGHSLEAVAGHLSVGRGACQRIEPANATAATTRDDRQRNRGAQERDAGG